MKHITLSTLVCGIILFAACKKDTTTPTTPTTPTKGKKDLVTDGKWKWTDFHAVMTINGKDSLINGWQEIKDCDKDDIITFSANGTGVIDEMATKCDAADPQTKNITWEMTDNETKVKVTDDKGTNHMTIMELTATKAVYRSRVATSGGDSITVQQTFTNVK